MMIISNVAPRSLARSYSTSTMTMTMLLARRISISLVGREAVGGSRRSFVVDLGGRCLSLTDRRDGIIGCASSSHTTTKTTTTTTTTTTYRYLSDVSEQPKKKIPKVKKKSKNKDDESTPMGRSRDLTIVLAALDAPKAVETPSPNEEEIIRREKVLKDYTVGRFKQHNETNHYLNCKIQMKKHAMDMLPKNSTIKEKALEIDWEGPPRWRRIPAWTPPIPGFDPKEFITHEE